MSANTAVDSVQLRFKFTEHMVNVCGIELCSCERWEDWQEA